MFMFQMIFKNTRKEKAEKAETIRCRKLLLGNCTLSLCDFESCMGNILDTLRFKKLILDRDIGLEV